MSVFARFWRWTAFAGLVLAALSPLTGRAQLAGQLSDQFTNDNSLNTSLWTTSSSLLSSLAADFSSTLITPTLSFSTAGMSFAGVNSDYEIGGVQSLASFQPPFTLTTTVTADQAHGNSYELFLVSAGVAQYIFVPGNANPANGSFVGIWVNYNNSGLGFTSLGTQLYSDPSTNVANTFQIYIEETGVAAVALYAASGVELGVKTNMQVGTGPFFVILGQREGEPSVEGANVATWENVSVVPQAPAPVLAPATLTNGTLTLTWSTVAGATYQAQYSGSLAPAQWNNLGSSITATNSSATTTDTPAPNTQRFYRVVLMP
jgi:hypothetical protein